MSGVKLGRIHFYGYSDPEHAAQIEVPFALFYLLMPWLDYIMPAPRITG